MATVIRLARFGAKKRPYYHVVVTDSRNARNSGNILEVVGKYDPMQPKDSDKRVILNIEQVKSWMAKGAKPSDRVYKFLANAGLVEKKPIPVQTKKHLQSEKTLMKIKDKQEKLAKIAEEKQPQKQQQKKLPKHLLKKPRQLLNNLLLFLPRLVLGKIVLRGLSWQIRIKF